MRDGDIGAALVEENVSSSEDENFPSGSDYDYIFSEASESFSDTDMEEPESSHEIHSKSQPFYLGKDGKIKW